MNREPLNVLFSGVKVIFFDFDGVFTDAKVDVSTDGTETVRCSRRDSLGIEMLRNAGIPSIVVTKEPNEVVQRRCDKMKIPCHKGIKTGAEKASIVAAYAKEHGISLDHVAYVGDDVQDLPAMSIVGLPCAPSDAAEEILNVARFVSLRRGGDHMVRDICNRILKAKNIPIAI